MAMSECPFCKKTIEVLKCREGGSWLSEFNGLDYAGARFDSDELGVMEYSCPECGETVAEYEDDAKRLLGYGD